MQNEDVRKYYDALEKRKNALVLKRMFDVVMSACLIAVLSPIFLIIWLTVKLDSQGSAIFKQIRITRYGKEFNVFKFRTMVTNAESLGSQVTSANDPRITRCGEWLRKSRLDELPQLFNILNGDISFVGVRPEVPRYVAHYSPEMNATLLMPAGVTSMTSILYKDESKLLESAANPDEVYVNDILPEKMKYNLEYIKNFGFWYDLKIMAETVFAVIKK
jgi:lipopolysaccharide/colanic/teichoic acid biosynthesis glycosyltransferase